MLDFNVQLITDLIMLVLALIVLIFIISIPFLLVATLLKFIKCIDKK